MVQRGRCEGGGGCWKFERGPDGRGRRTCCLDLGWRFALLQPLHPSARRHTKYGYSTRLSRVPTQPFSTPSRLVLSLRQPHHPPVLNSTLLWRRANLSSHLPPSPIANRRRCSYTTACGPRIKMYGVQLPDWANVSRVDTGTLCSSSRITACHGDRCLRTSRELEELACQRLSRPQ